MVVLDFELDGEQKGLYMDNRLYSNIKTKIKPRVKKKDFDWMWIVDGPEGSGKSVLAMQLARVVDPAFNLDRMCMTPHEFTKAVIRATKGQCVVFDEAFTGLSSRASLTEINRVIVSLMMEMRQKNLFIIIVMPTLFLLDRYVALFRARGLFHVYLKNGKRGRWVYFNNKKKKILYLKGKKLFSYREPRSRFYGKFNDQYTINEEDYRRKKVEALMNKSRATRAETYKAQRDTLFWIMNKSYKVNNTKLSNLCKDAGFNIARNTISEILIEKEKQVIQQEVDKEESEKET